MKKILAITNFLFLLVVGWVMVATPYPIQELGMAGFIYSIAFVILLIFATLKGMRDARIFL